jgi:hypothetical protein
MYRGVPIRIGHVLLHSCEEDDVEVLNAQDIIMLDDEIVAILRRKGEGPM